MKCASALSTKRNTSAAFQEICERVSAGLSGQHGSFAIAFVSRHHAGSIAELDQLCKRLQIADHVLAVTGESIVGDEQEIEDSEAASLWAIALPNTVEVKPVRLQWDGASVTGLPDNLAELGAVNRAILLLADPFSFPTDQLFSLLEQEAPGLRVMGGMASGSHSPGNNRLVLNDEVHTDGAVGLVFDGPLSIRTVVSQGCRPVGRPMIVTKAESNLIRELGRRPAIEVLRETYDELGEADQALIRQGFHVGRVINEYQESFGRGDFLIRNVMGADDAGGIAITDQVRVGQTVQFHVRDASTADEDLRLMLTEDQQAHPDSRVAGGLLFSCNGRGTRLFDAPAHDARAINSVYQGLPVAGFFAMGELGPVGGKNFVHGYTASLALFADERQTVK